jgi:hypothetical protein
VSVRRRLEALEGQAQFRPRVPEGSREARERMVEHLERVAALRRGELDPEEAAEVEAITTAVQARLASRWGEGRR